MRHLFITHQFIPLSNGFFSPPQPPQPLPPYLHPLLVFAKQEFLSAASSRSDFAVVAAITSLLYEPSVKKLQRRNGTGRKNSMLAPALVSRVIDGDGRCHVFCTAHAIRTFYASGASRFPRRKDVNVDTVAPRYSCAVSFSVLSGRRWNRTKLAGLRMQPSRCLFRQIRRH